MSGIGNRLTEIRNMLGFKSQQAFAEHLGVKRSTLASYENDTYPPSAEFLTILHERDNVNVNWVLSGIGEMRNGFVFKNNQSDILSTEKEEAGREGFSEAQPPGPLGIPIIEGGLSAGTRAALENGLSVDELSGAHLEGARSLDVSGPSSGDSVVYVDLYSSQAAGAGPAQEIEVYQPTTPQAILLKFISPWRPEQVKALEVRGDSMTKIGLFDRDIVLFVPSEREGDGVFVISIDNRMQVKRLEFDLLGETLRIISENDRYEPRILTNAEEINRVRIEGKVVGWLHRHPY